MSNLRQKIRSQIKPLPKARTFPTGWGGKMIFEQIAEQVTPRVVWKLKRYGIYGQDIPDCVQDGLMKLWELLIKTPDLLAERTWSG